MPKPHQELLLKAVLVRGDDAVRCWKAWRAASDLEAIDRASRRLLPLAYRNLRDAGLPGDDLAPLREAYEESRAKIQWTLAAARPVLEAFVAAGIEPLILKGAALARFYADDPALRPMRDVDVLVPPGQVERAIATLSTLGYEPAGIAPSCLARYAFRVSPGWLFVARNAPDVDLHWHVLHESRQPGADRDFWQGAISMGFQGMTVKALNATDQLLHVCVHGLQHEPQGNLRWIVDAIAILRHEAEPIDWQRLLAQVMRRRLVLQARYCFRYLAMTYAAPIPPEALGQLGRAPVSWLERMEFRARLRPEPRGALAQAILAQREEVRRGSDASLQAFCRSLPRHLWGAARWWQMPAWSVLDRLGFDLQPGTMLARVVFTAPRDPERPVPPPAYAAGQRLVFGRGGNGLAALRSGWSYAESVGVWSEGVIARLELVPRELPDGPLRLEIELAAAMVGESHKTLDVHVLVDSSRVARWRLTAPFAAPTVHEVTIPAGTLAASRPCTIDFRILRPRSPASLGLSRDQRLLGIHLSSLRLRPGAIA